VGRQSEPTDRRNEGPSHTQHVERHRYRVLHGSEPPIEIGGNANMSCEVVGCPERYRREDRIGAGEGLKHLMPCAVAASGQHQWDSVGREPCRDGARRAIPSNLEHSGVRKTELPRESGDGPAAHAPSEPIHDQNGALSRQPAI
jgi:hypothetical protein